MMNTSGLSHLWRKLLFLTLAYLAAHLGSPLRAAAWESKADELLEEQLGSILCSRFAFGH